MYNVDYAKYAYALNIRTEQFAKTEEILRK